MSTVPSSVSTVFPPAPFSVIEDVVGFRRARVEAQMCVSSPPSARSISYSDCRVADLRLIRFCGRCVDRLWSGLLTITQACGEGPIVLLTRSTRRVAEIVQCGPHRRNMLKLEDLTNGANSRRYK